MANIDAFSWNEAVKSEIEFMYSYQVWSLLEATKEIKPIQCKQIYKRKRGVDGKFETLKARLVVKGYNQKLGFDYKETFLPVVMLKSIKILLLIAVNLDYKIWQIDVKTTFLNELLEEDNNMIQCQPKGSPNQVLMITNHG